MITKDELVTLLKRHIPETNEGIQNDKNLDVYPRIVLSEDSWDEIDVSGVSMGTEVLYQVSVFTDKPRPKQLIDILVELMQQTRLKPKVHVEYIEDDARRFIHYAFTISIIEDLFSVNQ